MASVLSHPAVSLALLAALGPQRITPALAGAGCVASLLPDIDALGFAAGIPYGHELGHRGFTHSLAFALIVALTATAFARHLGTSAGIAFPMILVCTASHGLLDAMTTGGLGVAFFSPFSNARYFFPWRVIKVSPIGPAAFFLGAWPEYLEIRALVDLAAGFDPRRAWLDCAQARVEPGDPTHSATESPQRSCTPAWARSASSCAFASAGWDRVD